MLRPFPARFVCRPANSHSADLDEFKSPFLKSANLIRLLESLDEKVEVLRKHKVSHSSRSFIRIRQCDEGRTTLRAIRFRTRITSRPPQPPLLQDDEVLSRQQ